MRLEAEVFHNIIESTPLISIDLLICNDDKQVLLGKRLNRPARDKWFVPGGRIYKNESLDDAFKRITKLELGQEFYRNEFSFIGVFEHFYSDTVFCAQNQNTNGTHYVVLAYLITLKDLFLIQVEECAVEKQHAKFYWWSLSEANNSNSVHKYTKEYLVCL